jgi:hypothetical protein
MHRSIFSNCDLDDSIRGPGYSLWSNEDKRVSNLTLMAEYANRGNGSNVQEREGTHISKIMSYWEHLDYDTPWKVFQFRNGRYGNADWIDWRPEEA